MSKTIPLSEHKEIEKFISLFSIAELVHTLKYGKSFRKFKINFKTIESLIEELQGIVGFDIILKDKIKGVKLNGIVVSGDIIKFLDEHNHILDCIHVDVAKSHDLFFITYEKKIGRIKDLYKKIMTENKLMKQFN